MLGTMIDLVIGLVLIYFLFSLVVSGINEVIARWARLRAKYLEAGIRRMLGPLADEFFIHPTIASLGGNDGWMGLLGERPSSSGKSRKPSYIPSRTFATAVLSLIAHHATSAPPAGAGGEPKLADLQMNLETWLATLPDDQLKRTFQMFLTQAGNDLDRFVHNIEGWFDDSMDRVSGWYKRNAKRIMLVIGIVVAFAGNIDTLLLGKTLWNEGPLRQSLVSQATNLVNSTASPAPGAPTGATGATGPTGAGGATGAAGASSALPCPMPVPTAPPATSPTPGATPPPGDSVACIVQQVKAIQELHIPLGWTTQKPDPRLPANVPQWGFKVLGLLLTGVALSFGAPFWFDLLGRLTNLRASGPPPPSSSGGGQAAGSTPITIKPAPAQPEDEPAPPAGGQMADGSADPHGG